MVCTRREYHFWVGFEFLPNKFLHAKECEGYLHFFPISHHFPPKREKDVKVKELIIRLKKDKVTIQNHHSLKGHG